MCYRLLTLTACACLVAAPPAPGADNEQTLRKLDQKIQAAFDDVPLSTAIDFLAVRTGLTIDANWRLLGKIKVTKDTPVIFELASQSARTCLDVLCTVVGGEKMAWTLEAGVVKISTSNNLRLWRTSRTYSIRPAAEANTLTTADMSQRLIQLIRATEGSSLRQQGSRLVVSATLKGHRKVERLLALCVKGPAAGSESDIARPRVRLAVKKLPRASFVDTPVKLVVTWLQTMTGQAVVVDWPALKAVGVTTKTTVNVDMKNVSALTVLDSIVDQIGGRDRKVRATAIAEANVLMITTAAVAARQVHSVAFDILSRNRHDNTLASLTLAKALVDKIKSMMGTPDWNGEDKVFLPIGRTRLICLNSEREIKTVSDKIDLIWGQKRR